MLGTHEEGAICGSGRYACPHSGLRNGSCYVTTVNAPRATWKAARDGRYSRSFPQLLQAVRGRLVRHGAYGELTAIPWLIFKAICDASANWTAYTHQHACGRFDRYKRYAMASCDSAAEALDAQARGWRTFRVLQPGETLMPGEILCPASKEAGHRTTCNKCMLCNGSRPRPDGRPDPRANLAIYAHGARAVRIPRRTTA